MTPDALKEFDLMDPADVNDEESLHRFFEDYKSLSNPELARLLGKTILTIRYWKYKFEGRKWPQKKYHKAHEAPKDWDNEKWLRWIYLEEKVGINSIAKIVGRSIKIILNRFKKYNIKIRSFDDTVKSSNPCCNIFWIVEHYFERNQYITWCRENDEDAKQDGGRNLSETDCAKLANTTISNFHNWLTKLKICKII